MSRPTDWQLLGLTQEEWALCCEAAAQAPGVSAWDLAMALRNVKAGYGVQSTDPKPRPAAGLVADYAAVRAELRDADAG